MNRILAATGHRPDKLGGYAPYVYNTLLVVAISGLINLQPSKVILGMALGWDQAVGWACVQLKIPFVAAVPFIGQESKWPLESRDKYNELLSKAVQVEYLYKPGYHSWKMLERNKWMVDRAEEVFALYDGNEKGGTSHCVNYALKKGKTVNNMWNEWSELCRPSKISN